MSMVQVLLNYALNMYIIEKRKKKLKNRN